jgi:glucosamine-phosphate N-acetyltransferase
MADASENLKKLDLKELNECNLINKSAQDFINNNHISSIQHNKMDILFDDAILSQIKESHFINKYDMFFHVKNETECYFDLGDNLILRPLKRSDYSKNYIGLLSQLTLVGDVSKEQFEKRFDAMRSCFNSYYILVVEDLSKHTICATITHVYEQKFLRNIGARGRIEDVVVDEKYRGKKLSKLLLDVAVQLSKLLGCYKISLECKDHLLKLYQQFGFSLEENQNYLCQRF